MADIEIFVQGEGISEITLLRVAGQSTVREMLRSAQQQGVRFSGDEASLLVLVEDTEEIVPHDWLLEKARIGHRSRVHVHRCHKLEVRVNYNVTEKTHMFSSSTTVERVKQWAVGREGYNLPAIDATEHLLQLCHSTVRPDEDTHIGSLVSFPDCGLCFDLVPKVRVEG